MEKILNINIDEKTSIANLELILDIIAEYEKKENDLAVENEEEYKPHDIDKNCALCGRILDVKNNNYEISKTNDGKSGVLQIICNLCDKKINKKQP